MNLRDPRGRAIKDGIPTSPHGGRQSALVENNSDDSITAILESCACKILCLSYYVCHRLHCFIGGSRPVAHLSYAFGSLLFVTYLDRLGERA